MAHIHQNKPSFRYFAEPFNRPAHNSSDPDRAAPKGTDSLNTCAESQEHIPHKTRLQPGSSPAHRQMGLRRNQEVHTAPLMRPQHITQIQTEEHTRQLVRDQMTKSYNQFWIIRSSSGITHIPAIAETCIDNRRWHSICGWYYGTSTFKKSYNKPLKIDVSNAFAMPRLRRSRS